MGAQVTIKVGVGKLNKLMADMSPQQKHDFSDEALSLIVLHLQQEVTTSGDFIKHGRGDADPLRNFLTNRHGGQGLIGSIAPDYSGLPRLASLGSDLPYAGVHEFGSRPYLKPTFDKARRKGRLGQIAVDVIQRQIAEAGFK